MTRKSVLSVTPWIPVSDARYAGHQFYYMHLRRLAEIFDVVVLAPDTAEHRSQRRNGFPWQVELVPPLHTERTGLRAEVAALRLEQRGTIPSFAQYLQSRPRTPDIVELQWSETMPLAPLARMALPNAYIAAIQYDRYSRTLTWSKLRHLRFRRRARDTIAGLLIALEERRLALSCDLVTAFKEADLSYVREGTSALVLDPWIERPTDRSPSTETKDVLFVGAFNRSENAEGAMWLIEEVWPGVTAEHPDARLVLAGAGAGTQLLERQSKSITVTGFVEDLTPFYQAAHCCVAPIFAGGGLRFKVPQGLAYGIPMVLTAEALDGMSTLPRSSIAGITNRPTEFADAICQVLRDPDEANAKAKVAQDWVALRFSFDRTSDRILEHYRVGHDSVSTSSEAGTRRGGTKSSTSGVTAWSN
jgi:glycosyltransferase involved in cell wall biosynthesis